jgi:hypothetical protein
LKYKVPATKAFPSLSTVGSEDFCPRYLSSNESKAAKAESLADSAADCAEVALEAELLALVA